MVLSCFRGNNQDSTYELIMTKLGFIKFLVFKFIVDQIIKRQSFHHIETSKLTCSANQLTGFYMMTTLAFNELIKSVSHPAPRYPTTRNLITRIKDHLETDSKSHI